MMKSHLGSYIGTEFMYKGICCVICGTKDHCWWLPLLPFAVCMDCYFELIKCEECNSILMETDTDQRDTIKWIPLQSNIERSVDRELCNAYGPKIKNVIKHHQHPIDTAFSHLQQAANLCRTQASTMKQTCNEDCAKLLHQVQVLTDVARLQISAIEEKLAKDVMLVQQEVDDLLYKTHLKAHQLVKTALHLESLVEEIPSKKRKPNLIN